MKLEKIVCNGDDFIMTEAEEKTLGRLVEDILSRNVKNNFDPAGAVAMIFQFISRSIEDKTHISERHSGLLHVIQTDFTYYMACAKKNKDDAYKAEVQVLIDNFLVAVTEMFHDTEARADLFLAKLDAWEKRSKEDAWEKGKKK